MKKIITLLFISLMAIGVTHANGWRHHDRDWDRGSYNPYYYSTYYYPYTYSYPYYNYSSWCY